MRSTNLLKCAAAILMLTTATTTQAIPAKRGQWRTLTLTDGTTVTAQLMGDEHQHYYQTADGLLYTATETDGIYMQTSKTVLQTRRQMRARRSKPRREFGVPTHYKGTKKGIIILVNFKDTKFKTANNQARYDAIANAEGYNEGDFTGSVHDYFHAQSYGQFDLSFDVLGPITLANNHSYYGRDEGGEGNDVNPGAMVVEACNAVNNQVTWSDYDWDGNGEVDQVFILYAGKGQADGGEASTIWPHEWELTEARGSALNLQGTRINTYACGSELNGDGTIDGIGTICHEFTHCLGIPDFYDTEGDNFGMGDWSLMDYGCYNGDGFTPCAYTGYERWFCGWIEPSVIPADADMDIENIRAITDTADVYIIYNQATKNEYYILQNIQKKGWNTYAPGKGLLVLHVDYDKQVWQDNEVNNTTSRQRCTIIPADNSYNIYAEAGDPYPSNGNNALGNNTTPKAKLYNANSDGKKLLNMEMTNIKLNSNGTVSLHVKGTSTTPDPNPTPSGDFVFYESFDQCSGTGGNDGLWGGNIASAGFQADNDGWDSEKPYGANKCARFGTSSMVGEVTSPMFAMPASGKAILTFLAAPWNTTKDGNGLNVKVSGTGNNTSFTLTKGEWTECEMTIEATGSIQLTFTPVQRFFLDEVKVVDTIATGIDNVRTVQTSHPLYDLSGRRVSATDGRKGIYILNGRKYVR